MNVIHEFQKLIWLKTPKGLATVLLVQDHGIEAELYWTCIQHDTNEIWTWSNEDVRAVKNITLGRGENDDRAGTGKRNIKRSNKAER